MVITPLVHILLAGRLATQNPFRLAVHICLVLERNAAEVAEDVLHLGVGVAASGAAKVVDPGHADKDVVNHGHDNGDANRVTPDHNHSDNRGLHAVVVASQGVDGVNKVNLLGLRATKPAC